MTLTLELTESSGAAPVTTSHVFGEEGGTIGRAPTNSWILPHNKVSGLHARISCRNGVFYIEDTSRNGVCVNSPENRLVRNRPYALKSGDRLFIEPYEIGIWVGGEAVSRSPLVDPFAGPDPFQPSPAASRMPLAADPIIPEPAAGGEVDPLKFFDPVGGPPSRKRVELPLDDGLGQHYQPPAVLPDPTPPPPPAAAAPAIPAGYNPLADEPSVEPIAPPPAGPIRPRPGDSAIIRARRDSSAGRPRGATPVPAPPVRPDVVDLRPPVAQRPVSEPPKPVVEVPAPAAPEPIVDPLAQLPLVPPPADSPFADVAPPPARPPAAADTPRRPVPIVPPPAPPAPPPAVGRGAGAVDSAAPSGRGSDLAALLVGAGVPDAVVTPELTRNLGEILKVVVVGLMDVLQSRQRIKEEFRMQQTIFRPSDNNPLKFSVNVEDALHNLLVKRNPAYLGPVDAFADAFDDLRDHQLAMLAGMRVAFEAMLAEFDPDRMQQQFDAQLGKSSLALVPAKMRYWDLYRARRAELVKDPEEAFEHLFGEEFRRAYEEQFRKLKAQRRARATGGPDEIRPDRD